jgi:hypothetical protein
MPRRPLCVTTVLTTVLGVNCNGVRRRGAMCSDVGVHVALLMPSVAAYWLLACVIALLCCRVAVLLCCCVAVLLCCFVAVLQCCCVCVLLCVYACVCACHTAAALYWTVAAAVSGSSRTAAVAMLRLAVVLSHDTCVCTGCTELCVVCGVREARVGL